jgi:Fe-S-cluster containining protein
MGPHRIPFPLNRDDPRQNRGLSERDYQDLLGRAINEIREAAFYVMGLSKDYRFIPENIHLEGSEKTHYEHMDLSATHYKYIAFKSVLVRMFLKCTAFDEEAKKCKEYETRPAVCKNFEPENCGFSKIYKPVTRKDGTLVTAEKLKEEFDHMIKNSSSTYKEAALKFAESMRSEY